MFTSRSNGGAEVVSAAELIFPAQDEAQAAHLPDDPISHHVAVLWQAKKREPGRSLNPGQAQAGRQGGELAAVESVAMTSVLSCFDCDANGIL